MVQERREQGLAARHRQAPEAPQGLAAEAAQRRGPLLSALPPGQPLEGALVLLLQLGALRLDGLESLAEPGQAECVVEIQGEQLVGLPVGSRDLAGQVFGVGAYLDFLHSQRDAVGVQFFD